MHGLQGVAPCAPILPAATRLADDTEPSTEPSRPQHVPLLAQYCDLKWSSPHVVISCRLISGSVAIVLPVARCEECACVQMRMQRAAAMAKGRGQRAVAMAKESGVMEKETALSICPTIAKVSTTDVALRTLFASQSVSSMVLWAGDECSSYTACCAPVERFTTSLCKL